LRTKIYLAWIEKFWTNPKTQIAKPAAVPLGIGVPPGSLSRRISSMESVKGSLSRFQICLLLSNSLLFASQAHFVLHFQSGKVVDNFSKFQLIRQGTLPLPPISSFEDSNLKSLLSLLTLINSSPCFSVYSIGLSSGHDSPLLIER
jgi:hypothetical protein